MSRLHSLYYYFPSFDKCLLFRDVSPTPEEYFTQTDSDDSFDVEDYLDDQIISDTEDDEENRNFQHH